MALASEQWMLFGYDVRDMGRLWATAWREFLWADDSPVRRRLDDRVSVDVGSRIVTFQGGQQIDCDPVSLRGVALPEELVLIRRLKLPVSVLPNLESVLALEVNACSPFSREDTAYGWSKDEDDGEQLSISLAVISRSAVMSYLSRHHEVHEPEEREVWAASGTRWILVRGFGESKRQQSYRGRLLRSGGYLAAALALVFLMALASLGFKQLELGRLEAIASITQREAGNALSLRDRLTSVSETIGEVNRLLAAYPSPHLELARLTALLGDDAYIQQFQMNGREIRLRGLAVDAASIMQQLTEQERYASVTAPQAITRVGGTGTEQFYLNITLAGGDAE